MDGSCCSDMIDGQPASIHGTPPAVCNYYKLNNHTLATINRDAREFCFHFFFFLPTHCQCSLRQLDLYPPACVRTNKYSPCLLNALTQLVKFSQQRQIALRKDAKRDLFKFLRNLKHTEYKNKANCCLLHHTLDFYETIG